MVTEGQAVKPETPGNHAERFSRTGPGVGHPTLRRFTMEAQTSKKQYQAIAPVSRFDMRSSVGAQTKAVDPVSRFRWALSFPGIAPAAGKVLAALADHADQRKLTCFPSVETLARETQVHRRTVQTALRQLEAAGAILTDRSRGRSSSLYRLMIPRNPADSAPFNRGVSPPPNRARYATPQPWRITTPTEPFF